MKADIPALAQDSLAIVRGDPLAFVHKAIIQMVLSDLLRNETGNMALQHLGILWIIYEHSSSEEPITTVRLQELTKVHGTTIINYCTRLANLGLVKRIRVKAKHGRGRAYAYAPGLPEDLLSKVVQNVLERTIPFAASDAVAYAFTRTVASIQRSDFPSEKDLIPASTLKRRMRKEQTDPAPAGVA